MGLMKRIYTVITTGIGTPYTSISNQISDKDEAAIMKQFYWEDQKIRILGSSKKYELYEGVQGGEFLVDRMSLHYHSLGSSGRLIQSRFDKMSWIPTRKRKIIKNIKDRRRIRK